MEINHKIRFVEGPFETNDGKLICVQNKKYGRVDLCFVSNMNVPFAKIKLHSQDTFKDASDVLEDAYNLGEEIAKRWNVYKQLDVNETNESLSQWLNDNRTAHLTTYERIRLFFSNISEINVVEINDEDDSHFTDEYVEWLEKLVSYLSKKPFSDTDHKKILKHVNSRLVSFEKEHSTNYPDSNFWTRLNILLFGISILEENIQKQPSVMVSEEEIQQAANAHFMNQDGYHQVTRVVHESWINVFKAAYKKGLLDMQANWEQKVCWISIEDRLPVCDDDSNFSKEVIIKLKSSSHALTVYHPAENKFIGHDIENITHWKLMNPED